MTIVTPTPRRETWISDGKESIHAQSIGSDERGGDRRVLERHQLNDRTAVVHDGEADHQCHPKPKAVPGDRQGFRLLKRGAETMRARIQPGRINAQPILFSLMGHLRPKSRFGWSLRIAFRGSAILLTSGATRPDTGRLDVGQL